MKRHEHLIPIKPHVDGKTKNYLSFQVYYRKDGRRGIYMSAAPIGIEATARVGVSIRTFGVGTGMSAIIEETKRLNQKRVDALFAEALESIKAKDGPAWMMVKHVLDSNSKEIDAEAIAA